MEAQPPTLVDGELAWGSGGSFFAASPGTRVWPLTRPRTLNLAVVMPQIVPQILGWPQISIGWYSCSLPSSDLRSLVNVSWLLDRVGLIRGQSVRPDQCSLCFCLKLHCCTEISFLCDSLCSLAHIAIMCLKTFTVAISSFPSCI